MSSIGRRLGLLDGMAGLPPATSSEIVAATKLQERYVREWPGAMVTGAAVDYDPATRAYGLPPDHAALLAGAASCGNLAVFTQCMPLLATVEDDILDCFRGGGGVTYERYRRFHEVMAEDSGKTVLPALKDRILPLVPGLGQRLAGGIDVLDVGCGRGRAPLLMAARFPRSRFVGYDLSPEAIGWADAEAGRRGLGNLDFVVRDLSSFDREADAGRFGLVTTFDAVHDQADPLAVVRGIRRSLSPGGIYLAQDIKGSSEVHNNRDHPIGTLLYTVSCLHCMTVSLAQGGQGLGAMWGRETAEALFQEAGFASVEVHELAHDVQSYYYICRP
jgi:2-polyprenyl-3-methyl-5-hydroxy-6-metoxy-1,4-benzoquinol methylase